MKEERVRQEIKSETEEERKLTKLLSNRTFNQDILQPCYSFSLYSLFYTESNTYGITELNTILELFANFHEISYTHVLEAILPSLVIQKHILKFNLNTRRTWT
jgi:hypothetical protein